MWSDSNSNSGYDQKYSLLRYVDVPDILLDRQKVDDRDSSNEEEVEFSHITLHPVILVFIKPSGLVRCRIQAHLGPF
jgi:hypothetical protein